jgi:hypothetical protein
MIMVYFKILSHTLPGKAEGNHKNIRITRDLIPGFPEYKAGLLTTTQQCSVYLK